MFEYKITLFNLNLISKKYHREKKLVVSLIKTEHRLTERADLFLLPIDSPIKGL